MQSTNPLVECTLKTYYIGRLFIVELPVIERTASFPKSDCCRRPPSALNSAFKTTTVSVETLSTKLFTMWFQSSVFWKLFFFAVTDRYDLPCIIQFYIKRVKYHLRFNKYRNYITLDHIKITWQRFKRIVLFTNKESCTFPLRSVHVKNTSVYWNRTWFPMYDATML